MRDEERKGRRKSEFREKEGRTVGREKRYIERDHREFKRGSKKSGKSRIKENEF